MNFVPALAYHFCLSLPAGFTQPGAHLLAEPCTHPVLLLSELRALKGNVIRRATSAGGGTDRDYRAREEEEEEVFLAELLAEGRRRDMHESIMHVEGSGRDHPLMTSAKF